MTALGASKAAATSTRIVIKGKKSQKQAGAARDGLPKQAGRPPKRHIPEMEISNTAAREIKNKKQTSYETSLHFFGP